jgi:hypothetical protein
MIAGDAHLALNSLRPTLARRLDRGRVRRRLRQKHSLAARGLQRVGGVA